MARKGKHHKKALGLVDSEQLYPLSEAIRLAKEASYAKFDESVDIAIRLGVDPRQADQMIRGSVKLPHGTGKTVRVLVFAKGDKAKEAEEAGADFVGDADLVTKVEKGFTDFDSVVATPDMMASVGKLGKVLGPKGLMPNPKVGTVTNDVSKVVQDLKQGMIEYRVDKTGIIHAPVGRKSFDLDKLEENALSLIDSLIKAKPSSSKGQYMRGISISTTMGVGVKVDGQAILSGGQR